MNERLKSMARDLKMNLAYEQSLQNILLLAEYEALWEACNSSFITTICI